jgi:hypothetical protein
VVPHTAVNVHRFKADIGSLLIAEVDQLHTGSTVRQALAEIYDGESETRLGTDLLILRLPINVRWNQELVDAAATGEISGSVADWLGAPDATTAFERAADRPVHLLGFHQHEVILSPNINPNYRVDVLTESGLAPSDIIANIRNAELDCLLVRSRALLTSAQRTVFRAPSGRLVRNFIRVGNIQYDREAIDAVSFWLLPHMRSAAAILTDTWSISSIALNTARIAAIHLGGAPAPVELLPDYLQISEDAKKRAGLIVERLVRESRISAERSEVLCLVSATQSGSLQQRLDEVARQPLGDLKPRFVAIFALGETGMENLRDLSDDPRFQLLPPDASGAEPDRPIPIDPKVYFPLEFHDLVYAVRKPEAEASKVIMDGLAQTGLLRAHRDVSALQRTRHHAIHLDTEGLLAVPHFTKGLDAAVAAVTTAPIAVVTPPTPGCLAIAEWVATRLTQQGFVSSVMEHPNLFFREDAITEQDKALRERIRAAADTETIVIVVDAWINDASLSQFQRFLRSEGYRGRIHYIVGVARPPDLTDWIRSATRLRYRNHTDQHTVTAALELPLPDWTSKDCPWCAELRLYSRWSQRLELPPVLADRRAHLLAASVDGLKGEFALSLPGLPAMALGPGSFYVCQESSQVDAFAAVSSALQRLRSTSTTDRPPLGPRHFPTATVLKHGDYLVETWTDSVLRAVFLRAATAEELIYTDAQREADRAAKLRTLLLDPSPAQHDVALEILLAVALGKATLDIDKPLREGLANLGPPGLISYMLDMIEHDSAQTSEAAAVQVEKSEETT